MIEEVIKEPVGGAHRDIPLMMQRVGKALSTYLAEVQSQKAPYHQSRRDRFLAIGQ